MDSPWHKTWFAILWLLAASVTAAKTETPLTCFSTVYQPYVLKNEGEVSGIDVDVVQEVGRRIGLPIDIKLAPWSRIEMALAAGDIDCVFSYFRTPEREGYAYFTGVPMHSTQYTLFIRKEDQGRVRELADLYGERIGINRGFVTPREFTDAREQKKIRVFEVAEDSQSLQMLAMGRLAAVLTNADVGHYLISRMGLTDIVPLTPPLSTTPAYLVLRRAPEFEPLLERFNWALFEILRDGTYAEIHKRYMSAVGTDPVILEPAE